jgi:predicted transcriptional regulator
MNGIPDMAYTASLIADKRRAIMLDALLTYDYLNASELAKRAKITPQTASSHLSKLVEAGLISVENQGRNKYYKIAGQEVATALESLTVIGKKTKVHSLNSYDEVNGLRLARSCYDHLAGRLGVEITKSLLKNGYIQDSSDKDYKVTNKGTVFFTDLGMDIESLKKKKRFFARKCLDWSENKHHIAGSLGAAIQKELLNRGLIRKKKESRSIVLTPSGEEQLEIIFGVKL